MIPRRPVILLLSLPRVYLPQRRPEPREGGAAAVYVDPLSTLKWLAGNIAAVPLFVDPANADYRLAPGSPSIDAADNTAVPKGIETDLDGNPRFVDDPATTDTGNGDPPIVDMGAYEFPCDPCNTDCSADGVVNAFDIETFLVLLFDPDAVPCSPCAGNTDGDPDGDVNSFDIEPFLECLFP